MITIIKEGNKKVKQCSTCGCTFSYENEDVKGRSYSSSRDGIRMSYYCSEDYVECPQCKSEVSIYKKEVDF